MNKNRKKKRRKRKQAAGKFQKKRNQISKRKKDSKSQTMTLDERENQKLRFFHPHEYDIVDQPPNVETIDHWILTADLTSTKRKIYNWVVKNWGVSAVIAAFPSIFSIISSLEIISENVKMVMVSLTIIIYILLAYRLYADSKDKIKRDNGEKYYEKVISFDSATKDNITQGILSKISHVSEDGEVQPGAYTGKCKEFISKAKSAMTKSGFTKMHDRDYEKIYAEAFAPFINANSSLSPEKTIKEYINNAVQVLAAGDFFGQQLGISVFTLKNGLFSSICQTSAVDGDLPDSELNDKECTLQCVKGNRYLNTFYFENKLKAWADGHYKPMANEIPGEGQFAGERLKGSIYCSNISLCAGGQAIFDLYLCIVSYTKPLFAEGDLATRERVALIFNKIGSDIKREAATIQLYQSVGLRTIQS